jgi:hypothetical protein
MLRACIVMQALLAAWIAFIRPQQSQLPTSRLAGAGDAVTMDASLQHEVRLDERKHTYSAPASLCAMCLVGRPKRWGKW